MKLALLWGLKALLLLGVVLGGATARAIWSGEQELAASTAGLHAGDPREASVRARRAAAWYVPGAPHVRAAYQRLEALARGAEEVGDLEEALFSWRALRSASLESRWLLTPHADALARANGAIARLETLVPRPPNLRDLPPAELERRSRAALQEDLAPRAPWVLTLLTGSCLWLGGLLWVLRRGLDARGLPSWRRSLPALGAVALGVGLWVLALLRA